MSAHALIRHALIRHALRRIATLSLLGVLITVSGPPAVAAAPPSKSGTTTSTPISVVSEQETAYPVSRAGYRSDCYWDDVLYYFRAEGTLAPGQVFTWVSPKPVCYQKHVKLTVKENRSAKSTGARVSAGLVEYGLDEVPVRVTDIDRRTRLYRACSSDLGIRHNSLDPTGDWIDIDHTIAEPMNPVSWVVRNDGTDPVEIVLVGRLDEVPWQGGEGSWDGCVYPAPQ